MKILPVAIVAGATILFVLNLVGRCYVGAVVCVLCVASVVVGKRAKADRDKEKK
jgi:hypothetical protein